MRQLRRLFPITAQGLREWRVTFGGRRFHLGGRAVLVGDDGRWPPALAVDATGVRGDSPLGRILQFVATCVSSGCQRLPFLQILPTPPEPTSPVPLAALASATDSTAAQEATAPGREVAILPGQARSIPDAGLPRLALGLNAPWEWFHGSIGVSAYVGLGHHYAVRANVARYPNSGPLAFPEDLPSYTGKIFDFGVAWVCYPRQLWDGFMLEIGANRRGRDTSVYDSDAELLVRTQSTAYAGRLMIGWSWLVTRHLFIAVAAGISEGNEAGHETRTTGAFMEKSTTTAVNRLALDAEAYLRFGIALGH